MKYKEPHFSKYKPGISYNQCGHKLISYFFGYVSFFDECERRNKKGMKEKQCPTCGLFCFDDEMKTTNKKYIDKLPI